MADPFHLHPTAPLAERVLLPGDPGRALRLAQALLSEPRMFNHNRGLWGYTGEAVHDGRPLTIQSTGMGGPSAAIVIAELAELGARTLLRVGTCGALVPDRTLGEVLAVRAAIGADGTSRALGAAAAEPLAGTPELLSRLREALGAAGAGVVAVSSDLFYDVPADAEREWIAAGAEVVEMEAATLFALGARRGLTTGCLLVVSDLVLPARRRIEPDALQAAEHELGQVAIRALADE